MNNLEDVANLFVILFVPLFAVYQFFVNQQFHRLAVNLDQSLLLLHRARDAAIGMHRTQVFMLSRRNQLTEYDEEQATALGEHSAYLAELRGLALKLMIRNY